MGFNAVEVIEPLDWDFTGQNGPGGKPYPKWPRELLHAKGTITEPSDQQIGEFMDGLKALSTDAGKEFDAVSKLGEDPDPVQLMEALASLSGKDVVKFNERAAGLYSELCSGAPTPKQILLLPLRARLLFYNWIMSEVVSPEAGTGAGSGQVIHLPTAAAGSSST